MSRYAVFGAESGLGFALIAELLRQGNEVVVLGRAGAGTGSRPGLEVREGDPLEAEHVREGVVGAAAVVCLLESATQQSASPVPQVAATEALLQGLKDSGIDRLMLVGDVDVHLDTQLPAAHSAGLSTAQTSAMIVDALRRSDLQWTLVSSPEGYQDLTLEDFEQAESVADDSRQRAIVRLRKVAAGIASELRTGQHIRQYVNFTV